MKDSKIPPFRLTRAILARVLFALHGIVTVWRAVVIYGDPMLWIFAILTLLIALEGVLMIAIRGGSETRWFCPSIFLYLVGVVPPICFLELHISEEKIKNYSSVNKSEPRYDFLQEDAAGQEVLRLADGLELKIPLKKEKWAQILEQTLLVTLILGRWILPKGSITREQLSQLLLGHLATAADCVDFFEVFKEPEVRMSWMLTYAVLCSWSVSLLQYPLVLAAPARRAKRMLLTDSDRRGALHPDYVKKPRPVWLKTLRNINVWGILVSVLLQDLPFLIIRLYILSFYNVVSYTMIFFICKNSLICLLQGYRLTAVCHDEKKRQRFSRDMIMRSESEPAMQTTTSNDLTLNGLQVETRETTVEFQIPPVARCKSETDLSASLEEQPPRDWIFNYDEQCESESSGGEDMMEQHLEEMILELDVADQIPWADAQAKDKPKRAFPRFNNNFPVIY